MSLWSLITKKGQVKEEIERFIVGGIVAILVVLACIVASLFVFPEEDATALLRFFLLHTPPLTAALILSAGALLFINEVLPGDFLAKAAEGDYACVAFALGIYTCNTYLFALLLGPGT
jgi:hypothetical protein